MKIDATLTVRASTDKQIDFVMKHIKELFKKKGIIILIESDNKITINGDTSNKVEYYKIAKGRKKIKNG